MSNKINKTAAGYSKTIIHKDKLFRIVLPVIAIIIGIVLLFGISFYLGRTSKNEKVRQVASSIFNLVEKGFFRQRDIIDDRENNTDNEPDQEESSESADNNGLTEDGSPPDFMKSDKPTLVLSDELDSQITKLKKAGLDTALSDRLRSNAQEYLEKGEENNARNEILWALQLTRELLQLKAEHDNNPN